MGVRQVCRGATTRAAMFTFVSVSANLVSAVAGTRDTAAHAAGYDMGLLLTNVVFTGVSGGRV